MTGIRSETPSTAAVSDVDAAHLQYLIRAIVAASRAKEAGVQCENGAIGGHVVVDTDLDGVRYLLIRMPPAERMRDLLSPREFEIVRMVAQGYQNKIIASILNISSWTVCAHVRRVFAKLGVSSRAAMVARLLETDIGLQAPLSARPGQGATTARRKAVQRNAAPRSQTEAELPHSVAIDEDGGRPGARPRMPGRRRSDTAAPPMLTARY